MNKIQKKSDINTAIAVSRKLTECLHDAYFVFFICSIHPHYPRPIQAAHDSFVGLCDVLLKIEVESLPNNGIRLLRLFMTFFPLRTCLPFYPIIAIMVLIYNLLTNNIRKMNDLSRDCLC